jgi:hypothetical protein
MSHTADVVEVIVRSMAGNVMLGPELFSRVGVVSEMRTKLLALRHSRSGVDRLLLMCGADVLQDDHVVQGEGMECTALFKHEELSFAERRHCISMLNLSPLARAQSGVLKVFSDFIDVARADAQVVANAVRCNWQCLQFAHERLRADATFVSQMCRLHGQALVWASAELRGDKQFVLRQVRHDGRAIQGALPELGADRDFLLEALWRNPTALHEARFEIPDDLMLILAEDMSETHIVEVVDREEAFRQVHADGLWLANAVEFQDDKAIVLAAVQQNPNALRFTVLVDDRDVVLPAVQSNGKMLEFASEELRRDHEVVLAAMRSDPRAIEFAIDKPLFEASNCESLTQNETNAQLRDKRAGRVKRNGRMTRGYTGIKKLCGGGGCCRAWRCGCSFEP